MQGNVTIPQGLRPEDFVSLYAPQSNYMQQPMQPQNVPVAPVDQNFSIPNPEMGPQQTQVPPQLQHINDVLNEYMNSKQQQQSGNGITEAILAQRFQPNMNDISTAGLREAQSYAQKPGGFAVSPYDMVNQRMQNELAPYTTSLDLGQKQAALQGQQINNQYLPQELQSKIDLNKATALMDSGGGLFGGGAMAPNGQQVGNTGNNASGEAFLQTLSPAAANMVKAITEGRQPMPSGFILKTPFGQQLMAAVNKYDPTFDFVNANARMNTRKSFTSGADAQNIAALNTAMAHVNTLSGAFNDLGNTPYPMLNTAKNYLGNQMGNSAIQTNTANVSTDAEAVSHELAKVFRSTGMSEGEINSWKDKINTSASPDQMKATINSALDLMEGRMQALAEKYNQGMGTTKQGLELLSPQAQQAYTSLRGNGPSQNNQPNNQTQNRVIDFNDLP